jgi:hypothetical protein
LLKVEDNILEAPFLFIKPKHLILGFICFLETLNKSPLSGKMDNGAFLSIVLRIDREWRIALCIKAQGFFNESVAYAKVLGKLVALAAPVSYGLTELVERNQAIDGPGVGAVLVLGAKLKRRMAGVKALGQAVAELVRHTLKPGVLGGIALP